MLDGSIDEFRIIKGRALSADEIAETYRMGANHHLTRQISATDLSAQTKLPFWIAADRTGTFLEAMIGESDHANYELASSTLALSTTTVLYIKGDEIASSTSIKDSSFSGKAVTANGNARTSGNGKIGNSVYFDGTGDYLSAADSDDWAFGNSAFSIDFWVKFNSLNGADDDVFYEQYVSATSYIRFSLETGNTLTIYARDGGTAYANTFVSWTPSLNTPYHIAITREAATTQSKLFINGAAQTVSHGSIDSSIIPNYASPVTIGEEQIIRICWMAILTNFASSKAPPLPPTRSAKPTNMACVPIKLP